MSQGVFQSQTDEIYPGAVILGNLCGHRAGSQDNCWVLQQIHLEMMQISLPIYIPVAIISYISSTLFIYLALTHSPALYKDSHHSHCRSQPELLIT